jgi:hypothetical protein
MVQGAIEKRKGLGLSKARREHPENRFLLGFFSVHGCRMSLQQGI